MKSIHHKVRLKGLFYQIYKRMYKSAAKQEGFIFSILVFIKYRYLWRIRDCYLPAYILEGVEKKGNRKIRILFCGDRANLFYISNLFFLKRPKYNFVGEWSISKLDEVVSLFCRETDLVVVKTDQFFSNFLNRKGFVTVPAWVRMQMDISKPLEEIVKGFKKSAKEDVRKIKQHGYSFEISKSEDKFNLFFYNIRQPYFRNRIGEQALSGSENYHEIHNAFRYGRLFLVKDKDRDVPGFIVVNRGKVARPHFMGIKERPYFNQTAGSALFYLFMLWAKKQGFKVLDFGFTRAFLSNGAFRFKRKWGMHVKISHGFNGVFGFKVNDFESETIYNFFENNPFIYINRGKLNGFVFVRNSVSPSEEQAIYQRYFTPGLKGLYIISGEDKLKDFLRTFKGWKDLEFKREKLGTVMLTDKNMVEKAAEEYKLNRRYMSIYRFLVEEFPDLKKIVFRTLSVTLPQLKNRGFDVEKVDDELLKDVFSVFREKGFSKEGIPVLLEYILSHDTKDVKKSAEMCGLYPISLENAEKIIEQIVSERKEFVRENGLKSFKPLMGVTMKSLGGRVDGEVVSEILKSKIKMIIEE
ncbi:MAG: hypothetical protein J7L32_01380 [Thermoplasmata archaeon]|nr:hypothetical protein [Thermoplasmata archaeon]